MSSVKVHDKSFRPYKSKQEIHERVNALAEQISEDYKGKCPVFIGVLNGSFVFASDLFRALTIDAEISFVKLQSYDGTSSTGSVITAIGLQQQLKGRDVVILEDIVDTGKTLHSYMPELTKNDPASIKIASFLTKPAALQYDIHADYVGFEIDNDFVIGYGLDYNGLGRNLADLYILED